MKIGGDEWRHIVETSTLESEIYRKVYRLVTENLRIIHERMPKVRKDCSGYRLEDIIQGDTFDISRIFIASGGTLGIVLQAKPRILNLPSFRGTVMLQFDSLEKMGEAVG